MCNVEGPPLKRRRPRPLPSTEPQPIYLDYNATTPLCEEAWNAMAAVRQAWGNPSSTHPIGMAAKYALDAARRTVCDAIGAGDPARITFTSGGTEANNLAIIGSAFALRARHDRRRWVVSTNVEHPAVTHVLDDCARRGMRIRRLPVRAEEGRVDVEEWRRLLCAIPDGPESVALVSVMHANNEIGAVNPIAEIVKMVKETCGTEALIHTDAAQSIGKIPVNVTRMGVDLLSVCSHKFYGPKGVGALYIREGVELQNILHGAGHERGLRPGTENVLLAAGMAEAMRVACNELAKNAKYMAETRAELIRIMEEEMHKYNMWYCVNGDLACALPNTLNVALYKEPTPDGTNKEGRHYISAQRLIISIGDVVCMSAGSACHSSGEEVIVSDPLLAVGVDVERAIGTLRLSTGRGTTMEEVRRAGRVIVRRAAQQFAEQ